MEDKLYPLPLLSLKLLTVYPNMAVSIDIANKAAIKGICAASERDGLIFVTGRIDIDEKETYENIYRVGTVARITQVTTKPDNSITLTVSGLDRAIIRKYSISGGIRTVYVEPVEEYFDESLTAKNEAYTRALLKGVHEYFSVTPHINIEQFVSLMGVKNLKELTNIVSGALLLNPDVKQMLLEMFNVYERAEALLRIINGEVEIMSIEREIKDKVKDNLDRNQREYFLHEQLKVIHEELGDRDTTEEEAEKFRSRIKEIGFSEQDEEKLLKEVSRFEMMQSTSPDSNVTRTYLETVLSLPWNEKTEEVIDIAAAKRVLDEDHYGLEDVKERILEYLAVRRMTGGMGTAVMCLVGPPGVGKTSVAKSVARALNRKYVRISLGGIHDEADIRGHRKTYIGAMCGRIMDAVKRAGVKNPLILLDEIDKVGTDYRGDPQAALLEVLDYEQNSAFRDHYIELEFDLSDVMFITTANTLDTISRPLLDRMEVINLTGYTDIEKLNIAKRHLLPKVLKRNGMKKSALTVTDGAIEDIISYYTREAGVRKLEQTIDKLVRKAAKRMLTENKKTLRISEKRLGDYLGKHRYSHDKINAHDEVGIVRGLAWTAMGGETLSVEVNVMDGDGKVELTGQLGDVMKESAKTAIGYIRSRADSLSIEHDFYKTKDIHIHVPEGAVPKDGPSAGITMATAVVSSLTERAVRRDVAMTGEITLRGRVLPIGGLKEKSIAAYQAGIKTVIIPEDNKPDLDDIPEEIRNTMEFIPVNSMDTVLKTALI